jgi:hypothetical protein
MAVPLAPLSALREPTPRARLARVAVRAARSVDGVVETRGGPGGTHITDCGGELLPGVSATAARNGRFDLELRLVVRAVPLHELAERVRGRVASAARQADLADRLGPVSLYIDDVEEPLAP